jgi:hypothetical protein
MDIEDILQKLPKLSQSELTQIEQRIAFLKTMTSNRVKLVSHEEDFYDVLSKFLYSEKGIRTAPFSVFRNGKNYQSFQTGLVTVESFTKQYFPDINRVERLKLFHIYAKILCVEIEGFTGTTPLPIIASMVGKIPELFNRAFPGYVKAGLAKAVLNF